jgi:hypothetical protein
MFISRWLKSACERYGCDRRDTPISKLAHLHVEIRQKAMSLQISYT